MSFIPQPVWDAPGDATPGAAVGDTPAAGDAAGTPAADVGAGDQNGSVAFDPVTAYAALDEETRTWLQAKGFDKSPVELAKAARSQEKMLGGAIKVPGKDATPEERDAFFNKLGRPDKPEGYEFKVPTDLPEGLPYDAERATKLKTDLHGLGLTKDQAAAVHDMYINEVVGGASGAAEKQAADNLAAAEKATDALVKRWGPLDGDTAKANFELADHVFNGVPGGQEFLTELTAKGFVGEGKVVKSEAIAVFLSNIGAALFMEDGVLRGNPTTVGNPFVDGEGENVTEQMRLAKSDPDRARSLIAAAGKKPSDFGLK